MILLQLFWEFFKIGLFAIGGGPATLPFITALGEKTGWYTSLEVADMLAVAESTPGPMGINMATYVGFKMAGIPGGIITTLGEVTPSIIVILIVAGMLRKFKDSRAVKNAFFTIRPASAGLIASAVLGIWKLSCFGGRTVEDCLSLGEKLSGLLSLFDFRVFLLAVLLFVILRRTNKHPILYILAGALAGILIFPLLPFPAV